MRSILSMSLLVTSALAASRSTPPTGAITVGDKGTYSTIQDAVDSLSTTSTTAQSIFIYAGTYSEQVSITARKAKLTIYGETTDDTSYVNNVVTITNSASLDSGAEDDENTATVMNRAEGTSFYNIDMKNTYGEGSQALAISAYADEQGYYGCGFYSYQDTVMAETGNQVFAECYIEGAVDFIFGQHARAWFDSCDIAVSAPDGAITANGRASSSDTSYYVINACSVAASASSTATTGSVYLGRPWTEYARVIFQSTSLGSIIASAGWEEWSSSDARTDDVTFEEFNNSGTGASGTRATFASTADSAVTIETLLGSDYADWVDTSYLA